MNFLQLLSIDFDRSFKAIENIDKKFENNDINS